MNLVDSIRAARRCGVPLIVIRTADPSAAIQRIEKSLPAKEAETPILQWDVARGAAGVNESGAKALAQALKDADMEQPSTTNPSEFLGFAPKLPAPAIVFMLNLHRFCTEDIGCIQSLWNLRDDFKASRKTIIGLVPAITLPPELSQDVLVLDDPLPTDAELKAIAEDIFTSAQLPAPAAPEMERIVDATLGLAAFPAEQSMAMSIARTGMNIGELWSRKRSLVSQTEGLSIVAPSLTFADVGGVRNIKKFMTRIATGKKPPRCYVFIDEGEKAFAGSSVGGGDTSGVSQGFLGNMLTEMQDRKYRGSIFIGFPGSAKSLIAQTVGPTFGVPTIQFDLTGMKSSLVGSSEANLRKAFATVYAVSQGNAFFIMTCNSISTLPPELKRRYKSGIFWFDLPVSEERTVIWELYLKRYASDLEGLDLTIPNDEHWTGAEISTCVENSATMQCSLMDSAAYIVPAYLSMGADRANRLREEANDRYISASYPGPYQYKRTSATPQARAARAINFEDVQ